MVRAAKRMAESDEGKVFDAPEIFLRWVAAGEETGEEDEVCEGQEGEGDPEIEKEMVVERGAVGAGVGWGRNQGTKRSAEAELASRAMQERSTVKDSAFALMIC